MYFATLALSTLLAIAAAVPAPVEKRFPQAYQIIPPFYISRFDVSTGALDYDPPFGYVLNPSSTTTLVAFDIPQAAVGQLCTLHFYLDAADPNVKFTPNAKIDLFSSLNPAPKSDTTGWGPGNQRNQQLARFTITGKGEAGFSSDVPNKAVKTDCPPKAGVVGYELVGVGDGVEVQWGKERSGAYMTWERKS
jgi:hypothetical protein